MKSMQFSHALDCLVWSIVHADPPYGPVFLSKTDLKDGFYHVYLAPHDAAKLGAVFPSLPGEPPLSAIPLALPRDGRTPRQSSALPLRLSPMSPIKRC
jgi:hypothetical protein